MRTSIIPWALLIALTGACGSDKSGSGETSAPSTATQGSGGAAGAEMAAARCGNGEVEGNEACDDGNRNDADGCSNRCEERESAQAGASGRAAVGGSGGAAGAQSAGGQGGSAGKAGASGQGGAPAQRSAGPVADPWSFPERSAACAACRKSKCADFWGLGYNVVEGCLKKVDPQFDARADDPSFVSDCTAVLRCAYTKKCGFGTADTSECYCGTAAIEDCFSPLNAGNGPCKPEIEQACRSKNLDDISARYSDKAYPMGWAADLIDCDHLQCGEVCKP
jgi:cysteine-rich repeat protein